MKQQHPPFPAEPEADQLTPNVFALIALENDAAASRIKGLYVSASKRSNWEPTSHTNSLYLAYAALIDTVVKNVNRARDFGQLLYCWHGTKATAQTLARKGGAA